VEGELRDAENLPKATWNAARARATYLSRIGMNREKRRITKEFVESYDQSSRFLCCLL